MNWIHPCSTRKRGLLLVVCLIALSLSSAPTTPVALGADAEKLAESAEARVRKQHLAGLGVTLSHEGGYRGQGVKVAVLDSGFRGYRSFLGRGLPERVQARSFRHDGNLEARDSQHGILCGEVVHSLAPDAELLFANWEPDNPQQFLEAVRWARREGARVISCSVIMPSWSDGEGGGPVHADLTKILGADKDGTLCFAAAGNTAQRHWHGNFQDGGDGFHQWQQSKTGNPLKPWGEERVSIEMCWKTDTDYQMSVHERGSAEAVASSRSQKVDAVHSAVVRFEPRSDRFYEVRVRLTAGKPGAFHCFALHSGLGCSNRSGSVCFPADGAEIVAVGAVDGQGRRLSYSSCGLNNESAKPDLVAPVPVACLSRQTPFGGTSAAAPQAAALAALLWSRHPDWTAQKIRSTLNSAARDVGDPGRDPETGYGVLHLPDLPVQSRMR